MKNFCPNCGKPLKKNAFFCPNCGYHLVDSTKKIATKKNSVKQAKARPVRKMTPKKKIWLCGLGILGILLIVFYAWGSAYYSKSRQINRITTALKDPNADMSPYAQADTPDMSVTADSLKPLQNYYRDHQTAVTKISNSLQYDNYVNKYISLVRSGRHLLLFPRYKLEVKTCQPQVMTNHPNSTFTINGKNSGSLTGSAGKYSKKLSLMFPGKYHFNVKSEVAGRTLTASSTDNVFGNKTVNMNIATQTFSVKSVPGGEIYINDKKLEFWIRMARQRLKIIR